VLLRSVALKTFRDSLRGLLFWSLGLVGLVALTVSIYPSIRDDPSLEDLLESYPEALKGFVGFGGELDWTSAAGYLGVELFSLMIPLLLLIAAISAGSAAIAGEEERGTLELLLSAPVSRARVALEKLAAVVAEQFLLGAVILAVLVASARAADMEIGVDKLAAGTAGAVLLAVAFGAVALLAGALTGRRGVTVAIVAALAVAAYLVNSLAPLVSWLEWAQPASPFFYYTSGDPLRQGLDAGDAAVLLALAAAAAAGAVAAFRRRDLAV
jgi:ABC-2 type transport system permease protein